MLFTRLVVALVGLLAICCQTAVAQGIYLDAPGLLPKKPPAPSPDPKPPPSVWPRLDPGALLCRSEIDLDRVAANRSGGAGGGPVDCRILREPTGVTILRRSGGRSQVRVVGQQNAGEWTDVWLPEKAPNGR
jgi:hypothetical protein